MLSLTRQQQIAVNHILNRKRYILFGGGVGGGKSYLMAIVALGMANDIPGVRLAVCRKNRTTLKRTTYQTFLSVKNSLNLSVDVNEAELLWKFSNGSQIWFIELDETKDRQFDKIKGLELTAAFVDEAPEISLAGFETLKTRVGRCNQLNGKQQLAFIILTANPSEGWVKDQFYLPYTNGTLPDDHAFIPSLPSDNPHNSQDYLDTLNKLPLQYRKRYVDGDWSYMDDDKSLYKAIHLDSCLTDTFTRGTKYVGVDVAREGKDLSVIALIDDSVLVDVQTYRIPDTIELGKKVIDYAKDNGVGYEHIAVDAVGIGAGVVDYLRQQGYYVNEYKSGSRSSENYDMYRSEVMHKHAEAIARGDFKIWSGCPDITEIKREAMLHEYTTDDKVLRVESKQNIKKRLGYSPDRLDAIIMAYSLTLKPMGYTISDFSI